MINWELFCHFINSEFPGSHDKDLTSWAILCNNFLMLNEFSLLHQIFKLDEGYSGLIREKG